MVDDGWIRKKTGRWEVGVLSSTKITKGRGSEKKALGSQRDVAFWDVIPEKEPSYITIRVNSYNIFVNCAVHNHVIVC